jgi:hypothetical protein
MKGEASGDGVAALRLTRPDRWDQGRRTGATACPCGGHGLRPVGHRAQLVPVSETDEAD